mgnify:CR=1 FL=1
MSDIHPTQHPLDGKLEPETKDCFDDRAPLYSIAISLKRIADARGVSVPELCRQVVGVFVAQQEGELGALLLAEAEVADYRPSLGQS